MTNREWSWHRMWSQLGQAYRDDLVARTQPRARLWELLFPCGRHGREIVVTDPLVVSRGDLWLILMELERVERLNEISTSGGVLSREESE